MQVPTYITSLERTSTIKHAGWHREHQRADREPAAHSAHGQALRRDARQHPVRRRVVGRALAAGAPPAHHVLPRFAKLCVLVPIRSSAPPQDCEAQHPCVAPKQSRSWRTQHSHTPVVWSQGAAPSRSRVLQSAAGLVARTLRADLPEWQRDHAHDTTIPACGGVLPDGEE